MIYIVQNIVPILAATVAGLLFGIAWWKTIEGPWTARAALLFPVFAFLAEFWLACILAGALILAPPEAPKWVMTIATPIVIWMGFVLPTLIVSYGRRGSTAKTIALESGHRLAVMPLQAVVLQAIGLTLPTT